MLKDLVLKLKFLGVIPQAGYVEYGFRIEAADESFRLVVLTIEDAFLLSRPIKLLCQPECMGLCSKCGKNLNLGKCDCNYDEIDPRLQKLKMFLK